MTLRWMPAACLLAIFPTVLFAQVGDPPWRKVEGQPIETRPPEKADDAPLFPQQTRAPYHATAPFKVTVLTDKLYAPWNLAFLPDGNILVTERLPGTIRMVDKQGNLSEPFTGLSGLPTTSGLGMLDVALDPHFARNHRIFFAFFEYDGKTNSNTYVGRGVLDEQARAVRDAEVIFRSLPGWPAKRLGGKTGGRIVFDPQGNLILPIGDRSDSPPWEVAQRMDLDLGKIIRITPDGKPTPGNPFLHTPGALPEIWALGTRSQEGFTIDPATGKIWEVEHGPRGGDELNIIQKGKNYGWPIITHGIDYPGGPIGAGITAKEGLVQPVYYWDPVIAPSGLAFYKGDLFPQWKHSLFVGGLRGMMLDRLEIRDDKVAAEEPLLTDLHSRIRDVRIGPDGAVYVLTDSGTASISAHSTPTSKLLKLTPN
ncbi:MAG TPA: PQQ-dependent sugar dehydrogenase [Rhizomicrobium sp.]|jgi:glucose/arabinose dehydrogenase|nr:PQQ-dependent sugar dehydrogenase [Rhizomicrobium sp.]